MNRDEFKAIIRGDEGLSLAAYLDCCDATAASDCRCAKRGTWTIGHGHTGPDVHEGDVISLAQAEQLLNEDCAKAVAGCRQAFGWFNDLCDKRQNVLASMAFNMGIHGVLEFKKMLAAIETRDWVRAANEMRASKWSGQVGRRAARLADMLESGDTVH